MGAWAYMGPRLRDLIEDELPVRYIGRPERSSPAEGSPYRHAEEQAAIVRAAFADAPARAGKNGRRARATTSKNGTGRTAKAAAKR